MRLEARGACARARLDPAATPAAPAAASASTAPALDPRRVLINAVTGRVSALGCELDTPGWRE